MAKDPAFLFYSSDFLTGTMFMTNEQVGLYIRLLCAQHQHGGRIDTNVLRTQCESITNGSLVYSKFEHDDTGSFSVRLDEEMKKRKRRTAAEMNAVVKENLKKLLQDTSKFPKELILVGRCMNYIRAANWTHGTPIDRVAVLADIAQASVEQRSPSKGWFISAGSMLLRYLPGGSSYHKDINSE